MSDKKQRIEIIDAVRGLCVILMVIHHFLYDLYAFLDAPEWIFSNPVLDVLHYIFAGCFIALAGFSSRYSRSNVKRGLKVLIIAVIMSVVTWYIDMPIMFGVLHLLGICMVLYGLCKNAFEKLPERIAPLLYIALIALSAVLVNELSPVEAKWLWPFGFTYAGFYSSDYFPLLPWIFVFLFGTWLGGMVRQGRASEKFYTAKVKVLPKVGRHALIVYIIHQPVLFGITMLISLAMGKGSIL